MWKWSETKWSESFQPELDARLPSTFVGTARAFEPHKRSVVRMKLYRWMRCDLEGRQIRRMNTDSFWQLLAGSWAARSDDRGLVQRIIDVFVQWRESCVTRTVISSSCSVLLDFYGFWCVELLLPIFTAWLSSEYPHVFEEHLWIRWEKNAQKMDENEAKENVRKIIHTSSGLTENWKYMHECDGE